MDEEQSKEEIKENYDDQKEPNIIFSKRKTKRNEKAQLNDLQAFLYDVSNENMDDLISFIYKDSDFLKDKDKMKLLLQSIYSAIQWRPLKVELYISLIIKLKDEIKNFFTSNELCNKLFKNNFLRLKLYEAQLISFTTIIELCNESNRAFLFFLPEIRVRNKYMFRKKLRWSYHLKQEVLRINIENHKYLRQFGYDSSNKIYCTIRNDDIDQFQILYSQFNIDLSSLAKLKIISKPTFHFNNNNSPLINSPNIEDNQLPENNFRYGFYDPNYPEQSLILSEEYEVSDFLRESQPSLIELAAFFGSINIFKFLWTSGANLTVSLAKYAIAGGNIDIIKIIESCEKVFPFTHLSSNLGNNDNNYFLFCDLIETAIQFYQNEIVTYLIDNYSNIFFDGLEVNSFFGSILFLMKSIQFLNFHCFFDIVEYIKTNRSFFASSLNSVNSDHQNVIHISIEYDRFYMLKFFMDLFLADINVNCIDKWEETPLMRAAILGDSNACQYLCNIDTIDINYQDSYGWSALLRAVLYGNFECVKIICQNEAIDINCWKNDNETALHIAVNRGYLDIIDYLCSREGININIKNIAGKTPLELAIMQDKYDIQEYLKTLIETNHIQ